MGTLLKRRGGMVEGKDGLEERDPLFKKELLAVVLTPILAVGVDVDAADENAVSGVLKVTPAFELFLLSAFSNSGTLGIESVAPATKVEKLLELSGFGSELTPNLCPADSLPKDEEANVNCGIFLSALEAVKKLATAEAAFGSFGEATLSPKLYVGGETFGCFGDADLSYFKDDCIDIIAGGTASLVELAFGKAKPMLFSVTTGPSEVTSVFSFNAALSGGLNPDRDGGFSCDTTSAKLDFLSATTTSSFSLSSTNEVGAAPLE